MVGTFSILLKQLRSPTKGDRIENQHLLQSFIGGIENRWVEQIFKQIEQDGVTALSPIVFYGPSGVGKSALLMTILTQCGKDQKGKSRRLIHGGDFSRDLHSAIQTSGLDDFREHYRRSDLLVIDDLQEIATKPAAQEELISTLDAIAAAGGSFVTSLPRLPASIRGFKAPLISRLSAGFPVPVEPPGTEARLVLLNAFAKQLRLDIPAEWLEKLARDLPTGLRATQLKAALVKLPMGQVMMPGEPQDEALKKLLSAQNQAAAPNVADIAKAVAQHFQIKLADIRGTTRKANLVRMRGLAMHLCRQLTSLSLQQIGHYFGGRDHSTVLHACRKTEGDLQSDPDLAKAYQELMSLFLQTG
jgi:chromosomal replication initiator protein